MSPCCPFASLCVNFSPFVSTSYSFVSSICPFKSKSCLFVLPRCPFVSTGYPSLCISFSVPQLSLCPKATVLCPQAVHFWPPLQVSLCVPLCLLAVLSWKLFQTEFPARDKGFDNIHQSKLDYIAKFPNFTVPIYVWHPFK